MAATLPRFMLCWGRCGPCWRYRSWNSHLTAAHQERPRDVVIAINLASALAQQGRHREALEIGIR